MGKEWRGKIEITTHQFPDVADVCCELRRQPPAQLPGRALHLGVSDLPVLLPRVVRPQALPGEGAAGEVDEDVSDALQVVPPALELAQVAVDRHVARGARHRLEVPVGQVAAGGGVAEEGGKAEVHKVDDVALAAVAATKEEVLGLHVAVHQAALVNLKKNIFANPVFATCLNLLLPVLFCRVAGTRS